ncbi:hypothetical protein [Microbulbifer sp.]|uniref:hypothetical protein n=1 Tax=Microbulbifer sp. TaxID=1908541 RepID=UPI003F2FCFFE
MAVKNLRIPSARGEDKTLEICEFDEKEAAPTVGSFQLGAGDMKKASEKMAKSLTKKKETEGW